MLAQVQMREGSVEPNQVINPQQMPSEQPQSGWIYQSNQPAPVQNYSEQPTPQVTPPEQTNQAQQLFEVRWSATEYISHHHGSGWYLLLGLSAVIVGAAFYFFTKDFFAAGSIFMIAIIVAIYAGRPPKTVEYALNSQGLQIGQKFYPYNLFRSYSIIQDGGMLSLMFVPIKRFMPPLAAYFTPQEGDKILDILGEFLPHEENKLDAVERLSRRLRF